MVFDASAADLAAAEREPVYEHGAPAVLRGGGVDLLAPQPGGGARVGQRQLLAVRALCAVGHEKRMGGLEPLFQHAARQNAAAHDAQLRGVQRLAARRGQRRGLKWGITPLERADYKELLRTLDLGLEDRLTSKVGLLSGGQRQALTLLMASLKQPKLLLLDEHTAALDPKTAAKVLALSDQIVQENRLTTLMITHNMKDAIAHGNRLIMMDAGRVVVDISGEEKKKLTVPDLLALFSSASGSTEANDKLLLS